MFPNKVKKEQRAKEILKKAFEKGFKEGQGSSDVNPFKIKKEDVFIDPDDPNRSIEEQKRLRANWNHRKSYHRRKEKAKTKAEFVEMVTKYAKDSKKKNVVKTDINPVQRSQVD